MTFLVISSVESVDASILTGQRIVTTVSTPEVLVAAVGVIPTWGSIEGSIPLQTDLQSVLDGKSNVGHNHDGTYEPANANIQTHIGTTGNPHGVTKSDVGLGNCDNTSDADKPISTAVSTALSGKSDTTHNHNATYSLLGHDHTGVYEPADNTILKDADIGVNVAAFNHNHDGTYAPAVHSHDQQVTATFGYAGDAELFTGEARWYPPRNCTMNTVQAWVSTAPAGASLNFSINKNGVELLTGSIAAGSNNMTDQTGLSHALVTTDYLTVDIDQIGSTTPGKNLTIRMLLI